MLKHIALVCGLPAMLLLAGCQGTGPLQRNARTAQNPAGFSSRPLASQNAPAPFPVQGSPTIPNQGFASPTGNMPPPMPPNFGNPGAVAPIGAHNPMAPPQPTYGQPVDPNFGSPSPTFQDQGPFVPPTMPPTMR